MPYYEYEYMLEDINQIAKDQEEQNKKQQEDMDSMRSSFNPKSMQRAMSDMKMPSMGNISMPKINIPKI